MFEISELKAKTLAELQQIAKSIGLSKTSQLKKLDLVYQILDIQAATPIKEEKTSENPKPRVNKPKRKRVAKKVVAEESIVEDLPKPTSEVVEKNLHQMQTPLQINLLKNNIKSLFTKQTEQKKSLQQLVQMTRTLQTKINLLKTRQNQFIKNRNHIIITTKTIKTKTNETQIMVINTKIQILNSMELLKVKVF